MKTLSILLSQSYTHVIRREALDIQDHSAPFQVNENAHNMCDMSEIDLDKYECEDIQDITTCTASCQRNISPYATTTGILKKMCQCYVTYGPVQIYE